MSVQQALEVLRDTAVARGADTVEVASELLGRSTDDPADDQPTGVDGDGRAGTP